MSKSFGKEKVLNGISFTVNHNEIFCLLGKNGAGKTTLLNILTGQIGFDSGYINVFGM